jgi:HAD domain in Swiss Army Knife RNA repair proteins
MNARILVDVDGVLNPARADSDEYQKHWVFPVGIPHRLLLNPAHGRMLTELAEATGAELMWASYWRNRANRWVAPRVGLPPLRHVPIPTRFRPRGRVAPAEWKARHVAEWMGRTPFVWLEDDPIIPELLADRPEPAPHLIVTTDPATGLACHHIERARTWLLELGRHP